MTEPAFKLGRLSDEFHSKSRQIVRYLEQSGEQFDQAARAIREQLADLERERLIRIAFIGQYNAGKSTIIVALTGKKDIKIAADISTDQATDYQWNGILLTDTPGLYTELSEHDARTHEAIKNADLLVFVTTSDLPSEVVAENFIRIAYEQHYIHKMLFVLNKMSNEAGEYDALVKIYRTSLIDLFKPYHVLEHLSISYIDAADYIYGCEHKSPDLVELSHFNDFSAQLDRFIQDKGSLGKLDIPIRAVIAQIDQVILSQQSDPHDAHIIELLKRYERRLVRKLQESRTEMQTLLIDMRHKIIGIADSFVSKIGVERPDFAGEIAQSRALIQHEVEQTIEKLEQKLQAKLQELDAEIQDIFTGDIGMPVFKDIIATSIRLSNPHLTDSAAMNQTVDKLKNIAPGLLEQVLVFTGGESKLATLLGNKTLYNTARSVGNFFGMSLKSWEITQIGAFAAKLSKFAGPIAVIVGLALEAKQDRDDSENQRKIVAARNQIMTEFVSVANDIENQFGLAFDMFQRDVYRIQLDRIAQKRDQIEQAQKSASAITEQLRIYKQELTALLKEIYNP